MNSFEIEIKSLLGTKEAADKLIAKMKANDPSLKEQGQHSQINHYFINGDLKLLPKKFANFLTPDRLAEFIKLTEAAKDYSLRSRSADGKIILVMKVSLDSSSSHNGISRLEFESELPISLEELDQILLACGFDYQAKWSRERQTFNYKNYTVTIDKNAGYGYLAEFESVTTDNTEALIIKARLKDIMEELEVEELNQARLARMFDYYNNNWQDYYGTDKTFIID